MHHWSFKLVLILLLACMNSWAIPIKGAINFPVTKWTLKNGMTVIVHEDHSVPILTLHQWYRVGSSNEKPGRTGLAHFFEHLMFKGTKKVSGKEFEHLIHSHGGRNNAFTSRDYTGYYMDIPSDQLELMIKLESDRMRNLQFNILEIQKEREVVKEERRMRVENSIPGMMSEAIYNLVYKVHPYRWPVIGYMKDLNAASIDDLKAFYKAYYAPNNSVLVIAGDVSTKKIKALVQKYYGDLASQELPDGKRPVEPLQRSQRNLTLKKEVQNSRFSVIYKTSKAGDEDSYALDILANILGDGNSSRLHKRLVYKNQLATSASAYSYTPKFAGLFKVEASVKPKGDIEKALELTFSEIWKVRTKKVTPLELEKAKNQIIKSYVDSLKTISGKARSLAVNEIIFGDYGVLFKDLERYSGVTEDQILAVAKKYLKPSQRSIVRLLAKEKKITQ